MIFHDYERMSPPMHSTRPLNLESQLARARHTDKRSGLQRSRFSAVRISFSGLLCAVVGRIKALQLYQVPRIKSDPDV